MCRKGKSQKGLNADSAKPEPFHKHPVFEAPLTSLVDNEDEIPYIIDYCLDFLRKHGLDKEGKSFIHHLF